MKHAIAVMLASLVLGLGTAAPGLAGPYEDAAAAYQKKDYATALRLIRPLAEQGNAQAEFGLGGMYDMGQGVPQSDTEAAKWYRRAADQGSAIAELGIGSMYASGKGVPQDFPEAAKWYQLAADQGEPMAQLQIARAFNVGMGVPKDDVLAYKWFSLSAAQKFGDAAKMRDDLAARMTPAQLAQAQKLVSDWKPVKNAPPK